MKIRDIRWDNIFYIFMLYSCLTGVFSAESSFLKAGFALGVLFWFEIFNRQEK